MTQNVTLLLALALLGCAVEPETELTFGPADAFALGADAFLEIDDENEPASDVLVECDETSSCEPEALSGSSASPAGIINIPLRVAIFDDTNDESLYGDLEALNGAFASTQFRFSLAPEEIIRTVGPTEGLSMFEAVNWVRRFHRDNPDSRRGDRMMVYIFPELSVGGFSVLPSNRVLVSRTHGVYINGASLARRPELVFPHEVGHWLGLHHTFRGGCLGLVGDNVGDTPRHHNGPNNAYLFNSPCDDSLDTCEGLDGVDPVHNLMSYSGCPGQTFTPGQIARMYDAWTSYYADDFAP